MRARKQNMKKKDTASSNNDNNNKNKNNHHSFTHIVCIRKRICTKRESITTDAGLQRHFRIMHNTGAYSESNIPAIIQHAEQARRHNAIRPRSKGAREDRRERGRGKGIGERE